MKEQVGAAAGTAVSMVPEQEIPPPPEKPEEVVPQVVDLIPDKAERNKLIKLLEQHAPWQAQEKEAKKARKPLVVAIKTILGRFQIGKAAWEGNIINYYGGEPRKSIKADKLTKYLTNVGWQPNQVAACLKEVTDYGKASYTLKITPAGGGDDDEE